MASLDVKRKFEELEATYIDRQVMTMCQVTGSQCTNKIQTVSGQPHRSSERNDTDAQHNFVRRRAYYKANMWDGKFHRWRHRHRDH